MIERGTQRLAAIVDGAGSWGSGREAADLTRTHLSSRWASAAAWTVAGLAADIAEAIKHIPDTLRDPYFGWDFSITALLCSQQDVELVAAGLYRVDILGPRGADVLFRPRMLLDEIVASGALTPESAVALEHQNICFGPFISDGSPLSLTTRSHSLLPGDLVVVTHGLRDNAVRTPGVAPPRSAAELSAMAAPNSYASPVILVAA